MIEIGPIEQQLVKQAVREGKPIPERIQNAPELQTGLGLYLEAFLDLDSERSNAFGPGRIPLSKIFEYAACYQFDTEQTEDLVYLIREIDKAHVAKLISKNKTASNIDKGKQNQKRRRN